MIMMGYVTHAVFHLLHVTANEPCLRRALGALWDLRGALLPLPIYCPITLPAEGSYSTSQNILSRFIWIFSCHHLGVQIYTPLSAVGLSMVAYRSIPPADVRHQDAR